ncbi:hypothetical protein, partial [Agathobacter rectalis]
SLFNLYKKGYLAEHFALLGTSRRPLSDEDFQQMVLKSVNGMENEEGQAQAFAKHFFFQSHDVTKPEHYTVLKQRLEELDKQFG